MHEELYYLLPDNFFTFLQVFDDNQNPEVTSLPSGQTEASQAEGIVRVSTEPHLGIRDPGKTNSAEESDEGHSEDDVVGEINTRSNAKVNRLNKDPVVEFPSVRLLARALQPTNMAKRKAIISVQELPNVKQIIQRIEALKPHEIAQQTVFRSQQVPHTSPCKPNEIVLTTPCRPQEIVLTIPYRSQEVIPATRCKSPEMVVTAPCNSQGEEHTNGDNASSFVARQAARYSLLDRKVRSSLSRKQAIRVTGLRTKKPSGSDIPDGGSDTDIITQKNNNRSSYMRQNSERYHDVLDLVKTERNSGFLEVNNPFEDDFGCLLRVSTKSASMRQLNLLEQRHSASLKRSLPVSVNAKNNLQRSRTAMYEPSNSDTETKTTVATRNNSKKSSFRNALYVPFELKSANKKVEDTDSDDDESENIAGVKRAEHPHEFARSLDFEVLSGESSTSTELEQTSQSPEFGHKSFKQSWSFDGVIVSERDILETPPPLINEQSYPGNPSMRIPNRETLGSSSSEDSSSESSAVFDDLDVGLAGLLKQFGASEEDCCNTLSVQSDA